MTRADFLQLKYGRGNVLEPFLARAFGEKRIKHIVWVSPWLSHLDFSIGNTKRFIDKCTKESTWLTVITREPDASNPEHAAFVTDVLNVKSAELYYLPDLHAKFYICSTVEKSYALLGSANMYRWQSFEIGVVIESRGSGEELVQSLEDLAIDLRVSRFTKKVKGINQDAIRYR